MHVKKGDSVIVTTGKDKGKSGKVTRAFPKVNQVIVEDINIKKVHEKKKGKDKTGKIIERAYPIDASNVKLKK
jgi:large subunit ribosomal protein L24